MCICYYHASMVNKDYQNHNKTYIPRKHITNTSKKIKNIKMCILYGLLYCLLWICKNSTEK